MDARRVTVRPRESIVHERSSVHLVPVHPTRLFRLPYVLKIPQAIIMILILFLARFGTGPLIFHQKLDTSRGAYLAYVGNSSSGHENKMSDMEIFMTMAYFGTFAFELMLIVGVIAGDVAPTVNGLFATYGGAFFLVAGILGIVSYGSSVHIVIGSLAILNSLLFIAEIIVSFLPKFSVSHH